MTTKQYEWVVKIRGILERLGYAVAVKEIDRNIGDEYWRTHWSTKRWASELLGLYFAPKGGSVIGDVVEWLEKNADFHERTKDVPLANLKKTAAFIRNNR